MEVVIAILIVLAIVAVGYGLFVYTEKRQATGLAILPEVKNIVPMPPVKPTMKEVPAQEFSRQPTSKPYSAPYGAKTTAPVSPSRMGAPAPTSYSRPAPRRTETLDTSHDYLTPALIVSSFDDSDTYSSPSVDTSSRSSYSSDSCSPSRDYSSYDSGSSSSSSYDSGSSSSSSSSCD